MTDTEQKPYRKIKPHPIHPHRETATVVHPKPHPCALKMESSPVKRRVSSIVACQPRPAAQLCDQDREGDPAEDDYYNKVRGEKLFHFLFTWLSLAWTDMPQ
jgi:hypothetical protein